MSMPGFVQWEHTTNCLQGSFVWLFVAVLLGQGTTQMVNVCICASCYCLYTPTIQTCTGRNGNQRILAVHNTAARLLGCYFVLFRFITHSRCESLWFCCWVVRSCFHMCRKSHCLIWPVYVLTWFVHILVFSLVLLTNMKMFTILLSWVWRFSRVFFTDLSTLCLLVDCLQVKQEPSKAMTSARKGRYTNKTYTGKKLNLCFLITSHLGMDKFNLGLLELVHGQAWPSVGNVLWRERNPKCTCCLLHNFCVLCCCGCCYTVLITVFVFAFLCFSFVIEDWKWLLLNPSLRL